MEAYDIYKDIALRTNGDIYVGVVGPVRTGKSTFIKSFMEALVIPNIEDKNLKTRTIDELPQSGDGKTIMTTQPKFVPEKGVNVSLSENANASFRMIDCVGFMVEGAIGNKEDGKDRLVKTPWSEKEIPFDKAGEIGTEKVIKEHSTVGIVVTADGSVTDIARNNYLEAEGRAITELKNCNKPFIVVLNSKNPTSAECLKIKNAISDKYDVPCVSLNATNLTKEDIDTILEMLLMEFPLRSIDINLDNYLTALSFENPTIQEIIKNLKENTSKMDKMRDFKALEEVFKESENFESINVNGASLGEGKVVYDLKAKQGLYYKVLSNECGVEINDDSELISFIKQLTLAKKHYDKIKSALERVEEDGYGIVVPTTAEMDLQEPELFKQGGNFGVKLKVKAPSLHIMKVDVDAEVCPIVGSQTQSEELMEYLLSAFKENPESVWETNMLGRTLDAVVKDSLNSKILQMPDDVKNKMRKTLSRIVNESKGGVLCILL